MTVTDENNVTTTPAAEAPATHSDVELAPRASSDVYIRKSSVSEVANLASGGWNAPWYISWFEVPFHIKDPRDGTKLPEAAGWAMDAAARGPLNQMGGFVGSAILRMAAKEAGCAGPRNCKNTVKGLQPSSLLTATSAITGVIASLLMPFVGAVVDHTKYRKHLGVGSGLLCLMMTGIQIGISAERNNWFLMLIVDAIQAFGLLVHTTAVFAYLPDLTTDEAVTSHYTSHGVIRQYCFQFVYTALLIIAGEVRDSGSTIQDTVIVARTAAGISFGFAFLFLTYAWTFLFRKRPALSKVPEGQTLINTGFVQVEKTAKKIIADYAALKWFMISLLWSPEAGAGVVLSIAVSFFTIELKYTGQDLAYISLILMVGNMVGAQWSKILCRKINPLNSYRTGLVFLSGAITTASLVLQEGPESLGAAYGFSMAWGFAMGWVYPSQRVLFCTLIPKGQETEFMGLFTFTGQILGWLPPLIVTIMNENGIELRYGLVSVPGFCMLAVLCTLPMGNYEYATAQVAHDSEDKLKQMLQSPIVTKDVSDRTLPKEEKATSSETSLNDDKEKKLSEA